MKLNKYLITAFSLLILTTVTSCDNPTKDKNGNSISLARIDLPESDARFSFIFTDHFIGDPIEGKKLQVEFHGKDGGKLININGRYASKNAINAGMLDVNLDPNIVVSKDQPSIFSVSGLSNDGILILPTLIEITEKGDYGYYIATVNVKNAPKSAFYSSKYGIITPDNKLSYPKLTISPTAISSKYIIVAIYEADRDGIYKTQSPGMFKLATIDAKTIGHELFGRTGDYLLLVEEVEYANGAITINTDLTCSYRVDVKSENTQSSTFVSSKKQAYIQYVSNGALSVNVTPLGGHTFDKMEFKDVRNGDVLNVKAMASTNALTYHVDATLLCPNNRELGFAFSRAFQYKKASETDAKYIPAKFEKGKCQLSLEPNTEYTFRMDLGNGKIRTGNMTTDPNHIAKFLQDNKGIIEKYEIKEIDSKTWSISFVAAYEELCENL